MSRRSYELVPTVFGIWYGLGHGQHPVKCLGAQSCEFRVCVFIILRVFIKSIIRNSGARQQFTEVLNIRQTWQVHGAESRDGDLWHEV